LPVIRSAPPLPTSESLVGVPSMVSFAAVPMKVKKKAIAYPPCFIGFSGVRPLWYAATRSRGPLRRPHLHALRSLWLYGGRSLGLAPVLPLGCAMESGAFNAIAIFRTSFGQSYRPKELPMTKTQHAPVPGLDQP
jgi:hypothetical protein